MYCALGYDRALMRSQLVAGFLAFALIAAAFVPVHRAVQGLSFPVDIDEFRDIAAAQSIADGGGLRDPFYYSELLYYNPLLPATVAGISVFTSRDAATAYLQSTPLLNGLLPVLFYLMGAMLLGPWPALIGLSLLLFSPTYMNAWATPSYSPWLYPVTFTAGIFYASLIACYLSITRPFRGRWVVLGVALGATFLGHTAPALVLGVCELVTIFVAGGTLAVRVRRAAAVFGVAIIVSAPLLWPIAGHYHLRILNTAPATFVADHVDLANAAALLQSALTVWNALALVGLIALARDARWRQARHLLFAWIFTASALFLYGWLLQIYPDRLLAIVPQYHFYFSLRAAGYLLTGLGAWVVIDRGIALLSGSALTATRAEMMKPAIAAVLAATIAVANYDMFRQRPDFEGNRDEAEDWTKALARSGFRERLRAEVPPDGVVLANDSDSIYRVAPCGRSVVAVRQNASNMYVDFAPRRDDQARMLSALLERDMPTFTRLAQARGVTHVLLGPDDMKVVDAMPLPAGVREAFRIDGYALLAVTGR